VSRALLLALVTALAATAAAAAGKPSLLDPSSLKAKAPPVFNTTFKTTKGTFVITVHRSWSPHGADRFYNLVANKFYDGARFFRVVPGFVVQFGISPSPTVSAAWLNATIPDDPVKKSNTVGMVTYAATGQPDSRTTQVFINLANNASLDAQGFAPFGQVTSGMKVVVKLYPGYGETPTGQQGQITQQGEKYLARTFPKLDRIITARIG
jgi:cyclophilin family peptidyl-prolyl cis-trans isomerase